MAKGYRDFGWIVFNLCLYFCLGCSESQFESFDPSGGSQGSFAANPVDPILPAPNPSQPVPDSGEGPVLDPAPAPQPDPGGDSEFELSICSKLSFDKVQWPNELNFAERESLALALNVSGSFEGRNGWSNLTNNFDGQGISFGLLNQTLGTGSMQPLLGRFQVLNDQAGISIFGSSNWNSLRGMIEVWHQARGIILSSLSLIELPSSVEREFVGSKPDQDKTYADRSFSPMSANGDSVRWALNTVYVDDGKTFKMSWRNSFRELGSHPDYISQQIEAATAIHNRAIRYFNRTGFTQLRGYLFLFDIVVQNGSLREKHFNQFADFVRNNPGLSEQEYMLELLEIRVVDSNPRWQEDVRRRKRAVILDEGIVHGASRNFPDEYCFEGGDSQLYQSL